MDLNPVEELQGIWVSWVATVLAAGADPARADQLWADARNTDFAKPNCVLDSELILTFLYPQFALRGFAFDPVVGGAGPESAFQSALQESGVARAGLDKKGIRDTTARLALAQVLASYFKRHTYADGPNKGRPNFSSSSYFITDDEAALANVYTVDGYTFSMTASLLAKVLAKRVLQEFVRENEEGEVRDLWEEIQTLANLRFTESLQGLIASFAVFEVPVDEWEGNSQWEWPGREKHASRNELEDIRLSLRALGFNMSNTKAFECGWSWGPRIDHVGKANAGDPLSAQVNDHVARTAVGAQNAPYLYFSVNAIDGIGDLSLPEIESGGALDETQLALASRLKQMADIALRYWSVLATSPLEGRGRGEWQVEALPWITSDGQGSLYWNLYLARIVARDSVMAEADIVRLTGLLERLAEAARITSRPFPANADAAIKDIHYPGLDISLITTKPAKAPAKGKAKSAEADALSAGKWRVYDFAPQLLKFAAQLLQLTTDPLTRDRIGITADAIWRHIDSRKDTLPKGKSWDTTEAAFPDFFTEEAIEADASRRGAKGGQAGTIGSWYFTERVMEALVEHAQAERRPVRPDQELTRLALSLAVELEWLLSSHAEINRDTLKTLRQRLQKLRERINTQPGLALSGLQALAQSVLAEEGT